MTPRLAIIAGMSMLAGVADAAGAEAVVCTPAYYYNSSEAVPLVIAIDADRMAGSEVTWIDLESGAYRQTIGAADGRIVDEGTLSIVNPGSMQERIDFVALNASTGLLLHLSFVDAGLPFTRVDAEGTVASGYCEYAP